MTKSVMTNLITFLEGDVTDLVLTKATDKQYHFTAIDTTRDNVATELIVTEYDELYDVEMTINNTFRNIGSFAK